MSNRLDRRSFLKGAAASAAAVIGTQLAAVSADAQTANGDAEAKAPAQSRDKVISRPGSDFMVDVIKRPASSTSPRTPARASAACRSRSSTTAATRNRNSSPACTKNRRSRWPMATPRRAGKPMGMMAHGTVGLQHATMAVYNAWCDRVPMMMFAGNFLDADKRRPGVEWYHCCRTRRRCCAISPSGTISRCRCSTSPSRWCAPTRCHDAAHGAGADHRRWRSGGRADSRREEAAHSEADQSIPSQGDSGAARARRPRCWSPRNTR